MEGADRTPPATARPWAPGGFACLPIVVLVAVACGGSSSSPSSSGTSTPLAISVTPSGTAIAGVTVLTFTAQPASEGSTYAWEFGDGARGEGPSVTHRYDGAGEFEVWLSPDDAARTHRAEMVVRVRSLSGRWSTRDDSGPAGFGFIFELDQAGVVLEGRVTLFSLCPIFSGPTYYPPGTIDGWVESPRRVGWTLNCGGRVSHWIGDADATLDELHMRPPDAGPDEVPRIYFREPEASD